MKTRYVISDLHLGHERLLQTQEDRPAMRQFASADEMNERIIDNWNAIVADTDRVYILGDIAMQRRYIPLLGRLKGRKKLIRGNHDIHKLSDYTPYFDDITACVVYEKRFLLTHFPIHSGSIDRYRLNIHGHLHRSIVMLDGKPDPRYVNVCVEQTDYKPVNLDKIIAPYRDYKLPATANGLPAE